MTNPRYRRDTLTIGMEGSPFSESRHIRAVRKPLPATLALFDTL